MEISKYHVKELIFMLDCARKYLTPEWIKKLIDEISAVGYTAINIHFAEDVAIRLESKTYPWLAGGDHTLCGYGAEWGCPQNDGTYIFPPFKEGNVIEAPNEKVKGAGFCLWCDTPGAETQDELLEHIRPYFTALAKKAVG